MKRIALTLVFILGYICTYAQYGYRYGSEYIRLEPDHNKMYFIQAKDAASGKDIEKTVLVRQRQKMVKSFSKISTNRFLVASDQNVVSASDCFVSDVYKSSDKGKVIVLPRIVLSLKKDQTIEPIVEKLNGRISVEQKDGNRYILKCHLNHSKDVLDVIAEMNTLSEIEWCEPEMLLEYKLNNPLYPKQYYLKNTGQNGGTWGIDINVEPAWRITNGSTNVKVAVIDVGVDRNHEDMGNRVLAGYTIGNPGGHGVPQNAGTGIYTYKEHGMACAGIIAASNNSIGIRGVASNVCILPINIAPNVADAFYGGFGTTIEIAEAIKWAWQRADILSCSWGGTPSNDIASAINDARKYGRNGKGCVVIGASGNGYPKVANAGFPSNIDGVITVGAIDDRGVIRGYSQRGAAMDLVAPSGESGPGNGNIYTTDRPGTLGCESGNYTGRFGGTSAACPQVAGVAALMLSVNPALTETQVRTILQNTAKDLGTPGFDYTYGYGLVDAYAAVSAVNTASASISGPSEVCDRAIYKINNLPSGASVKWSLSQSNHPNPFLTNNNPQNNQCELVNAYGYSADISIIARIERGGSLLTTLSKKVFIRDNTKEQKGRYTQEECSFHGVHHASLSGNLSNGANFLHQGCMTKIHLDNMYGKTVVFDGSTPPLYWSYDKDNSLLFLQLPLGSGAVPFTFLVKGGCKGDKRLLFFSKTGNSAPPSPFLLFPNPATDVVTLKLTEPDNGILSPQDQGSLTTKGVTNTYEIQLWSGLTMLKSFKTNQPTFQIPIAGLPAGLYFVRVIKDGQTYTEKLIKN